MFNPVQSSDAREAASAYGEIIGEGQPRNDGGWDFLVVCPAVGEMVVTVTRDENGSIAAMAA